MTDADRLRAAADILAGPEGVTRSLLVIGHRGIDTDEIAALLRAVAENHLSNSRNETCACEWDGRYTDKRCTAAFALADVILGGSDE